MPLISIVSRIELENGVHRGPEMASTRRRLLDELLTRLEDCRCVMPRPTPAAGSSLLPEHPVAGSSTA